MLGLRGVRLGHRHPRAVRDAGARDPGGGCRADRAGRRPPARDHDPARGVGDRARPRPRRRSPRSPRRSSRSAARPSPHKVGTMIELPRAAVTADEIAQVGGVLLLRHQRPDPDDVGLLARRRRGRRSSAATSTPASSRSARSRARHRRRRPAGPPCHRDRPRGQPRPARSGSVASTAATRRRSTSSTRSGWTTCPARRSGCRSPGWRPVARRFPVVEEVALRPSRNHVEVT